MSPASSLPASIFSLISRGVPNGGVAALRSRWQRDCNLRTSSAA